MALIKACKAIASGLQPGEYAALQGTVSTKGSLNNNAVEFASGMWALIVNIEGLSYTSVTDSRSTFIGLALSDYDDAAAVSSYSVTTLNVSGKKYVILLATSATGATAAHTITFS